MSGLINFVHFTDNDWHFQLGDDADAVVDTSVDPETGMPATTIYSPYWVVNKVCL